MLNAVPPKEIEVTDGVAVKVGDDPTPAPAKTVPVAPVATFHELFVTMMAPMFYATVIFPIEDVTRQTVEDPAVVQTILMQSPALVAVRDPVTPTVDVDEPRPML